MVAKITYGSSVYGAVSYNHHKVEEGTARVLHTHNMVSNSNGDPLSFSQVLRSFEDYLLANKRTKTPVAHFSLNPAPEDKPDDDTLKTLAAEYMDKMGYKDQPYIVYKHTDIDREHIHIVSVRVDETGKKISDSYDYITSMGICRELEQKYGLRQITDEPKEEARLFLGKVDYEKGDIKRQISNILKTVTKDYKFQSFGEFNALLSCFNIHSKTVKGEEEGNLYHGIVYSVTNSKGELTSNPVKSSRIGKSFGYEALGRLINKDSKKVTPEEIQSAKIKSFVSTVLRASQNREQFILELKKYNIDTAFRQNDTGRIYGVTFVDHTNRLVVNGSRLGKDFSANVFNDHFNLSQAQQGLTSKELATVASPGDTIPSHTPSIPLDEIFGVFHIPAGTNAEEDILRKKRKKKKRRRRNL